MKLEDCIKCSYHSEYSRGQIYCRYWENNINSVATYEDRTAGVIYVVGCPKEKQS